MSAFTLANSIHTLARELVSAQETLRCLRMRREDTGKILIKAKPRTPSFYAHLEAWQKLNSQVEALEAKCSDDALVYQLQQLIDEYAREGAIT